MKKIVHLKIIFFMLLISGCSKEPEILPPYVGKISFNCENDPSDYFATALIGNEQLCYSAANPRYLNFVLVGTGFVSSSDSIEYNPDNEINFTGHSVTMGLGGLGMTEDGTTVPPPPIHFFIVTPSFKHITPREYILQHFKEGAMLDILATDETNQSLTELHSKFSIKLSSQYPMQGGGKNVITFQTTSGEQDPETAYLKVTEFTRKKDGTYDVTVNFQCKLYDNGRFFREVKNGVMRFNLNLEKL